MLSLTVKRFAAATFVGGALALSPVAMPAANAAPPVGCQGYVGAITTQTDLVISPSNLSVGDTFTATATVTANDVAVTGGTVTFSYANVTKTDTVEGGEASVTFQARRGRIPVRATYSGVCPGSAVEVLGSSSDRAPVVAGVSASAGGGIGGVAGGGGVAGASGSVGGLAGTGLDTQTELFGVLGVGMLTVGGLSLMVHRRRVQA